MAAQQKPKKERGTRNSARRNGKALSKREFDPLGRPLSGKGKPSGKSIVGFSIKRVQSWCENGNTLHGIPRGSSLEEAKAILVAERDAKKAARKVRVRELSSLVRAVRTERLK